MLIQLQQRLNGCQIHDELQKIQTILDEDDGVDDMYNEFLIKDNKPLSRHNSSGEDLLTESPNKRVDPSLSHSKETLMSFNDLLEVVKNEITTNKRQKKKQITIQINNMDKPDSKTTTETTMSSTKETPNQELHLSSDFNNGFMISDSGDDDNNSMIGMDDLITLEDLQSDLDDKKKKPSGLGLNLGVFDLYSSDKINEKRDSLGLSLTDTLQQEIPRLTPVTDDDERELTFDDGDKDIQTSGSVVITASQDGGLFDLFTDVFESGDEEVTISPNKDFVRVHKSGIKQVNTAVNNTRQQMQTEQDKLKTAKEKIKSSKTRVNEARQRLIDRLKNKKNRLNKFRRNTNTSNSKKPTTTTIRLASQLTNSNNRLNNTLAYSKGYTQFSKSWREPSDKMVSSFHHRSDSSESERQFLKDLQMELNEMESQIKSELNILETDEKIKKTGEITTQPPKHNLSLHTLQSELNLLDSLTLSLNS